MQAQRTNPRGSVTSVRVRDPETQARRQREKPTDMHTNLARAAEPPRLRARARARIGGREAMQARSAQAAGQPAPPSPARLLRCMHAQHTHNQRPTSNNKRPHAVREGVCTQTRLGGVPDSKPLHGTSRGAVGPSPSSTSEFAVRAYTRGLARGSAHFCAGRRVLSRLMQTGRPATAPQRRGIEYTLARLLPASARSLSQTCFV